MFPRYFSGEITNWPRLPCYSLEKGGKSAKSRANAFSESQDGQSGMTNRRGTRAPIDFIRNKGFAPEIPGNSLGNPYF